MRPDARDEFSGAERLYEIIIGSRLRPSTRASSPARAESMINGRVRVRSSSRSRLSKPKPSRRGIITSAKTRSGGSSGCVPERFVRHRRFRLHTALPADAGRIRACQRYHRQKGYGPDCGRSREVMERICQAGVSRKDGGGRRRAIRRPTQRFFDKGCRAKTGRTSSRMLSSRLVPSADAHVRSGL